MYVLFCDLSSRFVFAHAIDVHLVLLGNTLVRKHWFGFVANRLLFQPNQVRAHTSDETVYSGKTESREFELLIRTFFGKIAPFCLFSKTSFQVYKRTSFYWL